MKKIKQLVLISFWGLCFFLTGCDGQNVVYDASFFRADENNCWPCRVYDKAFSAVNTVLDTSLSTIAHNSSALLSLCLIFWILFKVASLVGTFAPLDLKKEFTSVITVLFKALIVYIFLAHPIYIYNFFGGVIIQPIGKVFVSLSGMILQEPTEYGVNTNYGVIANFIRSLWESFASTSVGRFLIDWLRSSSSSNDDVVQSSQMFGAMQLQVRGMVFQIYDSLWRVAGLGFNLMSQKGWSSTFSGLFLVGGMLWLLLRMPLAFVDAFVRIGLTLLLIPLFMVGWVFSFPKDIVKKVIHNLFSGFFSMLFACIYITFIVTMFRVYETQENLSMLSVSAQITDANIRSVFTEYGTDSLILFLLVVIMVKLSDKIQDFSNYFFEGAEKSSSGDEAIKFMKGLITKTVRIGTTFVGGVVAGAAAGKMADMIANSRNSDDDGGST